MRIGLAKATVLVALAHAITLTAPLVAEADVTAAAADGDDDDVVEVDAAAPAAAAAAAATTTALPAGCEVQPRAPGSSLPPVIVDARKRFSPADMVTRLEKAVVMLKQVRSWRRRPRSRMFRFPLAPRPHQFTFPRAPQVFSELPSYDAVVPALLRGGVARARAECALTPGIPVAPMLAKPTKGAREILKRFEGARAGARGGMCARGDWARRGAHATSPQTRDGHHGRSGCPPPAPLNTQTRNSRASGSTTASARRCT